jgi:hypothetical protein
MYTLVKKNKILFTILSSIFSLLNFNKSITEKKGFKLLKKNISKNEQIHNNDQKQIKFSRTNYEDVIALKNEISESIHVQYPPCGTTGIIPPFQEKQNSLDLSSSSTSLKDSKLVITRKKTFKTTLLVQIVGLLTILLGIIMYFISNYFSLKTSATFIIIGAIIIAFYPNDRETSIESKKIDHLKTDRYSTISQNDSFINKIYNSIKEQFDISEIITIAIILWIIFFYIITGNNKVDMEIFFISIYLGFLGLKVITHKSLQSPFKQRMNFFVVAFLFIFIIIVIYRIISLP